MRYHRCINALATGSKYSFTTDNQIGNKNYKTKPKPNASIEINQSCRPLLKTIFVHAATPPHGLCLHAHALAWALVSIGAESFSLGRPAHGAVGAVDLLVALDPLRTHQGCALETRRAASEAVGGRTPVTVAPVLEVLALAFPAVPFG